MKIDAFAQPARIAKNKKIKNINVGEKLPKSIFEKFNFLPIKKHNDKSNI